MCPPPPVIYTTCLSAGVSNIKYRVLSAEVKKRVGSGCRKKDKVGGKKNRDSGTTNHSMVEAHSSAHTAQGDVHQSGHYSPLAFPHKYMVSTGLTMGS